MDAKKVKELKLFIQQCESNPSILQDPSLRFFRDYLESLHAKLPASAFGKAESAKKSQTKFSSVDESDDDILEPEEQRASPRTRAEASEDHVSDEEIVESEVELDNEGVIEPDDDLPQKMGDPSVEVDEENRDAAQMSKAKAMEAIAEGDFDAAINHLTEAIVCNPLSAILYANRAAVFVKMRKPNAAIRDANMAIELNSDSAKGYKSRGMAKAMLGQWEEAAKDLHLASRLDYDEEIGTILKKVEPNAHKLEEHRRKYERLQRERDERRVERERRRRRAEAQAAYEKAKAEEQSSSRRSGGMPSGFPGGMPGGFPGGMPSGFSGGMPDNPDMGNILNDPEIMAAFKDPEVMSALQDVMKNPANLAKHQGNPKVAPILAKMMGKFASART